MKTLDEVITELEDEGLFPDALYYLQTYRADKLEWEQTRQANEERYQEAVKNCERAENKFIARLKELDIGTLNEPLTWEQLKQMEGKPVWVEDNIDDPEDLTKYWAIYRRIEKAQETEYALLSDFYYDKAQYGKTWLAYRKERK